MSARARRHGFVLILVIVVMVLTAGVLALTATWGAYRYRELQADRLRCAMRAVSDSAVAYARLHLPEWSVRPPADGIELDVGGLVSSGMSARAAITIETDGDRRFCRVSSRVERGVLVATDEIELPLGPTAATAPGTAPSTAAAAAME